MMQWLDHSFTDLLTQVNGLLPYFMTLSRYLANFLLFLNISFAALRYALTHQGFKEDMIKTATAIILFVIIINAYPKIITGLNRVTYKIAMTSTYTKVLARTIDKTRNDSDFWAKKGDKAEDSYSDIIKKVAVVQGDGQIGYKYVLDLYLPGTGYFSPAALMRVVMLILDNILSKANSLARNGFGIVHDMSGYLMLLMTALCVLFAGLLGFGQYFIAAIEFQLIAAVGVITLPGMLWNSTKFLTEKLIGAILGFFIKMIFVSIAIMLMFNGLLILMTQEIFGCYRPACSHSFFLLYICYVLPIRALPCSLSINRQSANVLRRSRGNSRNTCRGYLCCGKSCRSCYRNCSKGRYLRRWRNSKNNWSFRSGGSRCSILRQIDSGNFGSGSPCRSSLCRTFSTQNRRQPYQFHRQKPYRTQN